MGKHALLSASSSHRWMNCPPSARLCENIEDQTTTYAEEGSCAHALAEYRLLKLLGRPAKDPTEDLSYYDPTMDDSVNDYVSFITEQIEEAKQVCGDPIVLVEQMLNFTKWVPDGFGTCDCVIVADSRLYVIDLKYGKTPVEAKGNSQMRLYALAAYDLFRDLYEITDVSMSIFQPRLGSCETDIITVSDLMDWAEHTLRPAAEMAFKGEGEKAVGDWCRFCKIRAICRERAEANMLLAQHDFALPPTLTDEEIAVVLDKLDALVEWAGELKEYALQSAINGTHFDGWKLVEGRANRRYTDEKAIADTVSAQGQDPYEHKLLGITAMEKLLGKKRFTELLGDFVERPQGKPTLVPVSDKRPEMNTAKTDFANE